MYLQRVCVDNTQPDHFTLVEERSLEKNVRVLGIETSCDETGVAIYDGSSHSIVHALHSQVDLHTIYGGVVPELASREHILKLTPLIRSVLHSAQLHLSQIEGIAYTAGPGLVGALLTGATLARSLGWALQIPTIGIHHMEGHLLAPLLEKPAPAFPFLALLISGGHTQLVQVEKIGHYRVIGDTLDDAVGEAFDKTAKLMGLGYPGGAALAALAEQGDSARFHFSRPMTDRPGLDFSFSGLKTQVLTTYQQFTHPDQQLKADIACAFQQAVVQTLVIKCRRALQHTGLRQLVVAGGVSANVSLRQQLTQLLGELSGSVFFPRQEFCTDNGAMIAFAGHQRLCAGQADDLSIRVLARWDMETLQ